MGKRMITTLFLLLPITLFAQSQTERISHIRQVFQSINQDSTLKKVIIDYEQLLKLDKTQRGYDGGEEITGFYRRDTLIKIVNSVGLSTGMKTFEYYFENNKIIFIYERQDNYPYNEQSEKLNYNTLTTAFEGRYYLAAGKVIKIIETGNPIGEKNEAIILMKQEISKYSKLLLKVRKNQLRSQ